MEAIRRILLMSLLLIVAGTGLCDPAGDAVEIAVAHAQIDEPRFSWLWAAMAVGLLYILSVW